MEQEKTITRIKVILIFMLIAYLIVILNLVTLSPLDQNPVYRFLFELKKVY